MTAYFCFCFCFVAPFAGIRHHRHAGGNSYWSLTARRRGAHQRWGRVSRREGDTAVLGDLSPCRSCLHPSCRKICLFAVALEVGASRRGKKVLNASRDTLMQGTNRSGQGGGEESLLTSSDPPGSELRLYMIEGSVKRRARLS